MSEYASKDEYYLSKIRELQAERDALQQDFELMVGHRNKLEAEAAEHKREWDILEGACTFWKDTAIDLGYTE